MFDYYVVQPGDTFSEIAERFGVDMYSLYRANQTTIPDIDLIHPGQVVRIPHVN